MNKITPEDVVREFEEKFYSPPPPSLAFKKVRDEHVFHWLRSTLTTLVEAAKEDGKQAMREEILQSMSKIPAYGDGQIILKRQLISLLTPTDNQENV